MMNASKTIAALKAGHTLHGSIFGFFTVDPLDSRCHNINMNSARSLVRRKLIERKPGTSEWTLAPKNSQTQ